MSLAPGNPSESADVFEELRAREPIFHRPELGSTRADFERMTDAGFFEIGASGRRYSREYVLDELERRRTSPVAEVWEVSGFESHPLAPGLYLVTYTLLQDEVRCTRRATIWRRTREGWKIMYHQGTLVSS